MVLVEGIATWSLRSGMRTGMSSWLRLFSSGSPTTLGSGAEHDTGSSSCDLDTASSSAFSSSVRRHSKFFSDGLSVYNFNNK
jgi:hypothetical protein